MRRIRVLIQAGLIACLFSLTSSVLLAANPADAVPVSASAVIRWKAPEASWEKLTSFANGVNAQFGAIVENARPTLEPLMGLEEAGVVDMSQDVWAVVFAESQVEPLGALIFTASDLDTLQKEVPDEHLFISDKLVVYSHDKGTLTEIQRRIEGEGKSLWEAIDPASKAVFDNGDFSFVVNVSQLTDEFKDELQQAEPMLNAFIDQITNAVPEAQRTQTAAIFEVYRQLGTSILAGIQDTKSYTGAITIAKTAISYDDRIQIEDGTDTATMFAKFSPGPLSILNNLPEGKAIYFGSTNLDMSSMVTWSLNLTRAMMASENEDKVADMDKVIEEFGKLKFEDMAFYVDLTGTAPILQTGTVMTVNSAKKMRELSMEMIKSFSTVRIPPMTQTSTVEQAVDKIGGAEVDRITVTQEYDEDHPAADAQKKLQQAMFGENLQSFTLYKDTLVAQTMGGGIDELKTLIKSIDSKQTNATVVNARKKLPAKSNLIALIDVAHIMTGSVSVFLEQNGIPVDTAALKDLKIDPSYIGYSFSCEPSAAKSHLEIPVDQVNNIVKVALTLMPRR